MNHACKPITATITMNPEIAPIVMMSCEFVSSWYSAIAYSDVFKRQGFLEPRIVNGPQVMQQADAQERREIQSADADEAEHVQDAEMQLAIQLRHDQPVE